ncbi:MAG TPA: methionyl-tRNA formyltransferase [Candidatus Ozemobacteraceae bacterium]|nr:methionyl-tRNA formyltransferase [Candidatus Ozemobacteraceae bacterium]HQG29385.1 methionyl-tRNA formyltransferase [Candidatus Ozemobacteraceae bacterium]
MPESAGSSPLRVVFMGCPAFAVPVLKALAASPAFQVTAVYCMPDRPKGRGHKETATPIKQAAEALGLPVWQPASFRKDPSAVAELRAEKPDFLVVVAYGLILPQEVLDIPRLAAVNLHASLLPKYRGPSPIHAALIAGDSVTGNTVMLMNEKMDEGDILATETTPIAPADTLSSLHDRLSELGAPLVVRTLLGFSRGEIRPEPQNHALASYTQKISSDTAHLLWNRPATELFNLIRAMTPCPGAWFEANGERLKVGAAAVDESVTAAPGTVIRADAHGVRVACGEGSSLLLLKLQRPGKSMMPAADFLRGFTFPASLE